MKLTHRLRDWLSAKLVDLAILIEPPRPQLEALLPALREASKATAASKATNQSEQGPWSFYGLKEVKERLFERTDNAGSILYIHAANLDVAKELRRVASDCELGAIVGFRVTWLGPNNPVQSLVYPARPEGKG